MREHGSGAGPSRGFRWPDQVVLVRQAQLREPFVPLLAVVPRDSVDRGGDLPERQL